MEKEELQNPQHLPHRNDVLCGRGGLSNKHVGNVQFRSLVAKYKLSYFSPLVAPCEKKLIIRSIVSAVRSQNPPGRFLGKDPVSNQWFEVGEHKAQLKTSQALREKTQSPDKAKLKQPQKSSPTQPPTTPVVPSPPKNGAPPAVRTKPAFPRTIVCYPNTEYKLSHGNVRVDQKDERPVVHASMDTQVVPRPQAKEAPLAGIPPPVGPIERTGVSIGTTTSSGTSTAESLLLMSVGTSLGTQSLTPEDQTRPQSVGAMLSCVGTSFGSLSLAPEDRTLPVVALQLEPSPHLDATSTSLAKLYATKSRGSPLNGSDADDDDDDHS